MTFLLQFYSCNSWQCLSSVMLWFGKDIWGNVNGPCIFYREFLVFLERTVCLLRKGTNFCKLSECLQIKIRELNFMLTTQNQSALNKTSRSCMVLSGVLWKSFIPGWFQACLYLKTFNPFTAPGGCLSNVSFFCQLNIKNNFPSS